MEKGSKALLQILCIAFLLGTLVIGFNSSYREAFLALWHGTPADSPLWKSNQEYYPDVTLPVAPADQNADVTAASALDQEISHDTK
ncbi:MAG: hypothetical protein LBN38_01090 [Verrucomicrobiota bacterium]|jgi:hypothetical protein|nr:hypothetical protein [Verrucomicrobiota bacterium]